MHIKASENWLAAMGDTTDPINVITNLGGLTWQEANAALEKQYGNGEFRARDHGTVIVVDSYRAMRAKLAQRAASLTDEGVRMRRESMSPGGFHYLWYTEELERRAQAKGS